MNYTQAALGAPNPHSDELTWDPRDFDERTGYSEMRGPGAGWCIAMVLIPVIGVVVSYLVWG